MVRKRARGGEINMKRLNRNDLAKFVAEQEGLKEGVSIAQIKEILKVIFTQHDLEEIVEIWQAYNR